MIGRSIVGSFTLGSWSKVAVLALTLASLGRPEAWPALLLYSLWCLREDRAILPFLIGCLIVPLIGNGLRVVGIILLAHFTNNAYGAGADHIDNLIAAYLHSGSFPQKEAVELHRDYRRGLFH